MEKQGPRGTADYNGLVVGTRSDASSSLSHTLTQCRLGLTRQRKKLRLNVKLSPPVVGPPSSLFLSLMSQRQS
ncbi:hypothetical protein BaRGS_00002302, partial [Batillaria attramentaria]